MRTLVSVRSVPTLLVLLVAGTPGCIERSGRQVSRSQRFADDPHVALDGSGRGVGIWTENTESPEDATFDPPVGVIVHARFESGAFAAPIVLETPNYCCYPRVGMHGDGSAHAVWLERVGTPVAFEAKVQGAQMAADGTWTITELQGEMLDGSIPSLATNRNGDALAAWWAAD